MQTLCLEIAANNDTEMRLGISQHGIEDTNPTSHFKFGESGVFQHENR
jgi:hypothetical protein